MPRSNPREACVLALTRWESERTFADDLLHEYLGSWQLSALDRAFLTEAFYGIVRNLSRLDFIISQFRDTPLDAPTRQVLRLGFYQIFHMRIPHHAAVNETVNLAGKARGLVNALLRRGIREHDELLRSIESSSAAIRYSHPEFLLDRWQRQFGSEKTQQLCVWNNGPAEIHVRANGLKVTTGELLRTAPEAAVSPAHPLAIKIRQIPYPWIMHGLCYVQDPSTLLACDLLDPQPGEAVLDACAAPGGKTTYLAQLMHDEGRIAACDTGPLRLKRLQENLDRLGITSARVHSCNWLSDPSPFESESFDRVLLDAPCSNTGVIRRRVDVRWRLTTEDFQRMHDKQFTLLAKVAPLLKKGGTLVYSSCSLEPEENDKIVERVTASTPELQFVESRQSLPFRDNIDGAFAAKFVKN
jgi:16S rRNA (cytosine967-C5)-methyltransferase